MRAAVQTFGRLLGLFMTCVVPGGCAFLDMASDPGATATPRIVTGRVRAPAGWSGPIVVAAYSIRSGRIDTAHAVALNEPGPFELVVPEGDVRLLAFDDRNANSVIDPGEGCGEHDGALPRTSSSGHRIGPAVDIELKAPSDACPLPFGTRLVAEGRPAAHAPQAGTVVRLDDPLLSSGMGLQGYWRPMRFAREAGSNIYFTAAYDSRRIPVLFVHGAAGSPQDWRHFLDRVDRGRFQPWLFHYPSGQRLDLTSDMLFRKLQELQTRHHFPAICIAAHSMGGLVVRDLLINHGAELPFVSTFVSMSTPWKGEPMAAVGVRLLPRVVPSWNDMQPDGSFLQSLFAKPLPAGVDHYLLFSFRGGPIFSVRTATAP